MSILLKLSRFVGLSEGIDMRGQDLAKRLAAMIGLEVGRRASEPGITYFVLYDKVTNFPIIAIYNGSEVESIFIESDFFNYLKQNFDFNPSFHFGSKILFSYLFDRVKVDLKDITTIVRGARKYLSVIRRANRVVIKAMKSLFNLLKELEKKYPERELLISYEETREYVEVVLSTTKYSSYPGVKRQLVRVGIHKANFDHLGLHIRVPGEAGRRAWKELKRGGALLRKLDDNVKDVDWDPDYGGGFVDVIIIYHNPVSPKDTEVLSKVIENNLDFYFQQ